MKALRGACWAFGSQMEFAKAPHARGRALGSPNPAQNGGPLVKTAKVDPGGPLIEPEKRPRRDQNPPVPKRGGSLRVDHSM